METVNTEGLWINRDTVLDRDVDVEFFKMEFSANAVSVKASNSINVHRVALENRSTRQLSDAFN